MTAVVAITDDAYKDLRSFAERARPNETGGLVLGVIGAGRPWITRIVHIQQRRAKTDRYRIARGITPHLVAKHQLSDPRLGYLGDWHTHPAGVPASPEDRSTLVRVAGDIEAGIKNPLLVLVRRVDDAWAVDILETRGRRHIRCSIQLTGPLSAA